jgi:hypothetical protein
MLHSAEEIIHIQKHICPTAVGMNSLIQREREMFVLTNMWLAISATGYILHCASHFSLLLFSEEDKYKGTENKRGF